MKTITHIFQLIEFKSKQRELIDKLEFYPKFSIDNCLEFNFNEVNEILDTEYKLKNLKTC